MRQARLSIGAVSVLGFALGCIPATAPAAVSRVAPGQSIQEAVDAASPGDTIIVMPGDYTETHAGTAAVRITKPLRLLAKSSLPKAKVRILPGPGQKHGIIVEPANQGDPDVVGVTIKGFTDPGLPEQRHLAATRGQLQDREERVDRQPGERHLADPFGERAREEERRLRLGRQRAVGRGVRERPRAQQRASTTARRASRSRSPRTSWRRTTTSTTTPLASASIIRRQRVCRRSPLGGNGDWDIVGNYVHDNNEPNDAPPGSMSAALPPADGILVLGVDSVNVQRNRIENNDFFGITVVDWCLAVAGRVRLLIEPSAGRVRLPDDNTFVANVFKNNGTAPTPFGGLETFAADITYLMFETGSRELLREQQVRYVRGAGPAAHGGQELQVAPMSRAVEVLGSPHRRRAGGVRSTGDDRRITRGRSRSRWSRDGRSARPPSDRRVQTSRASIARSPVQRPRGRRAVRAVPAGRGHRRMRPGKPRRSTRPCSTPLPRKAPDPRPSSARPCSFDGSGSTARCAPRAHGCSGASGSRPAPRRRRSSGSLRSTDGRAPRALRGRRDSSLRGVVLGARGESDLRLLVRGLRTGRRARVVRLGDQTSPAHREHLRVGQRRIRGSVRHVPRRRGPARRRRHELRATSSAPGSTCATSTGTTTRSTEPDANSSGDRGIERRPASTGVQGIPFPDGARLLPEPPCGDSPPGRSTSRRCPPRCSTKRGAYGADFSRGLRIADANKVTLYVSGNREHRRSGTDRPRGRLRGSGRSHAAQHRVAACPAGRQLREPGLGRHVSEASERCAGAAFDASSSAASTASRARSSRLRCAGPTCSAKRKPSRCFLLRRRERRQRDAEGTSLARGRCRRRLRSRSLPPGLLAGRDRDRATQETGRCRPPTRERLRITYPAEGTLFPPESVAPDLRVEGRDGPRRSLGRRGARRHRRRRAAERRSTRRAGDRRRTTGSRSSSAARSAMPRCIVAGVDRHEARDRPLVGARAHPHVEGPGRRLPVLSGGSAAVPDGRAGSVTHPLALRNHRLGVRPADRAAEPARVRELPLLRGQRQRARARRRLRQRQGRLRHHAGVEAHGDGRREDHHVVGLQARRTASSPSGCCRGCRRPGAT